MSIDALWDEMIRRIELELGRPYSSEERAALEKAKSEAKRSVVEMASTTRRKNALLRFIRKLMARQGTVMPDFDALYKKKAEIDLKLLGDQ